MSRVASRGSRVASRGSHVEGHRSRKSRSRVESKGSKLKCLYVSYRSKERSIFVGTCWLNTKAIVKRLSLAAPGKKCDFRLNKNISFFRTIKKHTDLYILTLYFDSRPRLFHPPTMTLDMQPSTLDMQLSTWDRRPSTCDPRLATLDLRNSTLDFWPSTLDNYPNSWQRCALAKVMEGRRGIGGKESRLKTDHENLLTLNWNLHTVACSKDHTSN